MWYLADGDDDIACAVLVAASTVRTGLRPNVDLVAIYNGAVPGRPRFETLGIKLIRVEEAAAKGEYQWRESFLKLRAAELFQYDRVVYFDVDAFPLGSLLDTLGLFFLGRLPLNINEGRGFFSMAMLRAEVLTTCSTLHGSRWRSPRRGHTG